MSAVDDARALATALGLPPVHSYPPFEQLFGWPLPAGLLPFADLLHTGNVPSIGATSWYLLDQRHGPDPEGACPPFRAFAALVGDPDRALDYFLNGRRSHMLVAGLLGIAEDAGGDIGMVDVGPGAVDAGLWVHGHSLRRLETPCETFAGFVSSGLLATLVDEDDEDDEDIERTEIETALRGLRPATPPDGSRVRQLEPWWRGVEWIREVLGGDWSDPLVPAPVPARDDAIGLHARLLAAVLTGDEADAGPLLADAERSPGSVTRALGQRVGRFLAGEDVTFGWLHRPRILALRDELRDNLAAHRAKEAAKKAAQRPRSRLP